MNKKIYLASPHMSKEGYELQFIKDAFDTNWIAPLGPNVDEFENEMAEKVGVKGAAALSSGTAALHLALKAAAVESGDIVLCQNLTFSASANPIIYQNAKPVFIGSDDKTWNISPKHLEVALEKYPKAKAVIAVNLYGISADWDPIIELCKKYNVTLIEDAAESLGSFYKGRPTGTFGDFGVFSFNGNKIITSSGGGMLVSDNEEMIHKVRFWATQSRDTAPHYQHSELGYNYRMSNIVAGIGRGQLKVLERRVEKKKYIYDFYKKELAGISEISFMPENEWDKPNNWLSCILLQGKVKPIDLINALDKKNIEARPLWKPMNLQPYYAQADYVGDNIDKELFEKGVCLPSDTKLNNDDLKRIVSLIRDIF